MGARLSITLSEEEFRWLESETSFTVPQLRRLYGRYVRLDKTQTGAVAIDDLLLSIPELALNPLGSRVVKALDIHRSGSINFYELVAGLSILRPGASRSRKVQFAFKVFDVDDDGVISYDDLTRIMTMVVGGHMTDEEVKSIVDTTMQRVRRGCEVKDEKESGMDGITLAQLSIDMALLEGFDSILTLDFPEEN